MTADGDLHLCALTFWKRTLLLGCCSAEGNEMTDTIFFLWQPDKARAAGRFSSKQGLRQHLYSVPINELKKKIDRLVLTKKSIA